MIPTRRFGRALFSLALGGGALAATGCIGDAMGDDAGAHATHDARAASDVHAVTDATAPGTDAHAESDSGMPAMDAALAHDSGTLRSDASPPRDSGTLRSDAAAPRDSGTATQTRNCAPNPHLCGYPDATNTGVPAGVTLRRVPQDVSSGPGWSWDTRYSALRVDGAGAVIEGLLLDEGSFEVYANDVTIKNCRVIASGESWGVGLRHASNVTVQDSEIYSPTRLGPDRLSVAIKDIYGDTTGTRVLRNEIYHCSTGVQIAAGLIEDNYIHDLGFTEGDHLNGTTSNGGTRALTIHHNTVFNPEGQTDAISLFQDFGLEANRLVDDNLVAGGGYCIYAGGMGRFGTTYNIRVTNNRVARIYFDAGGSYGWLAKYETGTGNVLSGNVWDDTGNSADHDFTTPR